ncbi:MAG: hypothetical protein O7H41_01385, partial [Planctomycetota bacterium]|nr:hypothetical protein [Planctomycetota bacterium]
MSWKEARETSPEFDSEAPHVDPAPLAPEGAEQERASKKTRASMTSMASQVLLLYFYTATAKDFFNLTDLLLPVEAFRLGLTGYLTAQVLIGGITAAVPSLGIHLLGRVKSFERPSWWGRLVWVSFLVGFLIFGILSYRAAMNSLGRVEIEVAEIRWDGKTNEFVVKAYLDKIVA